MDVLLTGGHGAIGRFVIRELLARNHDVTVFDIEDNEAYRNEHRYEFIEGDITSESDVRAAIERKDAVLNLAALKRPACNADPKLAQEVNIGGAVNVFEAASDAEARIVHMSSKSVFGHVCGKYAYPSYEPLDEGAAKNSTGDIYGLTKAATESYLQHYTDRYDLEAACIRFASTYGPGKVAVPGKGMLIPDLIEGAARGESMELSGTDEQNDWVYFGDLANGLVDAVEAPSLTYPVYHIGTGQLTSLADFADVLEEACPRADISLSGGLNPQEKDHPMYARMDISRATSDLGYEPEFTLRDGIRDYLEHIDADHEL